MTPITTLYIAVKRLRGECKLFMRFNIQLLNTRRYFYSLNGFKSTYLQHKNLRDVIAHNNKGI